jgi:hypothetical protein
MKTKSVRLRNGYAFTLQVFKGGKSHLIIDDYNLYPDTDSRSEEEWRRNGLLIPIDDLKQLEELWK